MDENYSGFCNVLLSRRTIFQFVGYSFPDANSVKFPFMPCLFGFLPHLCRSIFRVHSNTLSLSCLVPLTYFMAHRQRQEECLLLSVVSRSVGQQRRMRASFPPSFVSCPPFPANPYENDSRAGLRLWRGVCVCGGERCWW